MMYALPEGNHSAVNGNTRAPPGSSVEELKAQANGLFKERKYAAADEIYSLAVSLLQEKLRSMEIDDGEAISKTDEGAMSDEAKQPQQNKIVVENGTSGGPEKSEAQVGASLERTDECDLVRKSLAIILCNRALARLRLEQYGYALADASSAIEVHPSYPKAYYRRGSAYFALGKHKEALKDFKFVCKLAPRDRDALARRRECERVLKEIAFSEAIDSEKDRLVLADTIDIAAYTVDDNYAGPRLPEDGVATFEFVKALIAAFKEQKRLPAKYALMIIIAAKRMFDALPTIVDLEIPQGSKITVCGDTHGQFYDLCRIFDLNGFPSPENPYLFNGDFVDRGSFSVEVILTLFAFKCWSPESMHLTRGNHESQSMNKIYGFEGEVKAKYSETIFALFSETFRSIPLGYVLDGSSAPDGRKALVLHGGLFSRDGVSLSELRSVNRFTEPNSGLMSEMLWSDPQKEYGRGLSKRGIGISFGPDVTHRFLDANGLDLLVRSHEMKEEGYEVEADKRLITIFSAPNYCDQLGNKGAFIKFHSDMNPEFTQFEAAPHPNVPAMAYADRLRLMGIG